MWVLDTDISIELIRGRSPVAAARIAELDPNEVGVTIVSVAELRYGAMKSKQSDATLNDLETFLSWFDILPLTMEATVAYGELKAFLARRGQLIGAMDMLIAGIVLSRNEVLVTNNVREFGRVPGLRFENWLREARSS